MSLSGMAHYAYCILFISMYHEKHARPKITNHTSQKVQYTTQQQHGVK